MSNEKIIWIGVCIIVSLIFGLYVKQISASKENLDAYISTEATVTHVFPARMSRFGIKPARYSLKFNALDGKTYLHNDIVLSDVYNINDKVIIFYNQLNPDGPILDRIE